MLGGHACIGTMMSSGGQLKPHSWVPVSAPQGRRHGLYETLC
jgi:hypothetical protein